MGGELGQREPIKVRKNADARQQYRVSLVFRGRQSLLSSLLDKVANLAGPARRIETHTASASSQFC
jgi:hypothetical protein